MKLTVLGCAGSYPSAESAASCYLLEAEGFRVVLDLGNGAMTPLQKYLYSQQLTLFDIDAVAISHMHADHYFDLGPLYVARHYDRNRPAHSPPLPLYTPQDGLAQLIQAYGSSESTQITSEYSPRTWQEQQQIGPFTVTARLTNHTTPNYSLKFHYGNKTLVYSGDTDACTELTALAQGADLFLCEAGFMAGQDDHLTGIHLNGVSAGQTAQQAQVRRLVLTHIPQWHNPQQVLSDAATYYTGPIELAKPFAQYQIV